MSNRITRFLPYLIIIALALPLLAHVYLGQYNRAMADDFCFTERAQALGIAGTLDYWYNNWTGTYSSTFFQSLVGLARAWQWVPSVLIVLWFLAGVWAAYHFAVLVNLRQRGIVSLMLGMLIVYAANDGTANVFQSLYWTSGAITYTAAMIVFTFNLGVIFRTIHVGKRQSLSTGQLLPYLALIAGLCMFAGGFSPLFGAFQCSLFTLATLACLLFAPKDWKRTAVTVLGTALVFALISFLILLIAPGNVIRRAALDAPLSLFDLTWFTLYASVAFIATSAGFLSPMALITPLLVGGMIGLVYQPLQTAQRSAIYRRRWRLIGQTAGFGFVLITACFFAGVYAISDLPPARAYIVPQFVLVMTITAFGYIVGMALQRDYAGKRQPVLANFAYGLILLVLMLGPIRSALNTLSYAPAFRVYAAEWENRNTQLVSMVARGEKRAVLTPLTQDLAEYADLKSNSDDHLCIAQFYGLELTEVAEDA